MQRGPLRPGPIQSYACTLLRRYAADRKGSGRYPTLQEPGAAAKPGTSNSSEAATAANPGNHAYPPTAGTSAPAKPSQPSAPSEAPSNHAYKPMGATAPINATGGGTSTSRSSIEKAGPAYPPTAGVSSSSAGRGPPSGPPPSGRPPPEPLPGGRNKWRLHPYAPIDVRLLIAALVGLGAYYYYAPYGLPAGREQHQPNAGDGRIFGSPDSREPDPEQLDDPEGEPLPLDMDAVHKHQQRFNQRTKGRGGAGKDEQHQPNAGDGRILGSPHSKEPEPEQQGPEGGPLPLDVDAEQEEQRRAKTEEEQHQPRVGDGRILGSPKSKEPAPVILENGEPLPVDEEEVAKHQKQLEEKQAQRSARHENAHSDEFALSGDDKDKSARGSKEGKGKGGKDEKPEALGGSPTPAPARTDQLKKSRTADEMNADDLQQQAKSVKDDAKSAAQDTADKAGKQKAGKQAEAAKDSVKEGIDKAGDKAASVRDAAKDKAESVKDDAKSAVSDSKQKAGKQAEAAKESVKEGTDKAGDKTESVKDDAKAAAQDTAAAAEDVAAQSKKKGRKAMDEAMHVVKQSMSDTGGLGYFHDKTNKVKNEEVEEEVEQQGSPEEAQQAAVQAVQQMTVSHGPAADLPSRPILGVDQDLSGAALVRKAIEAGQGSKDDWAEFKYRHRQAEQDSHLLYSVLQQAEQFHQAEVDRLEGLVDAEAARADYILGAAEENIDAFAESLHQQNQRHLRRKQAELQRQRQVLARAAAEELVWERRQRMSALREIRKKLRSLEGLLQFRGNEQEISHTAHKLSVGAFALQSALDKGAPFESELQYLAYGCQEDPLVQTAVLSFQQQTALQGIPTRAQLVDRWSGVSRVTRQLAAIPQGQGGPLSIAVASLASALKIREGPSRPGSAALGEGGLETRLAQAEACLVSGQLSAAASQLQKVVQGTEAASVVQDWVQAAQARAVAEQTCALLQAHAATLAASLSHE
ncbi:hypothetical protein WJX82_006724 [Trebouxia sp. C0006]